MAVILIADHGWKQLTFGNDESICPDIGERFYCTACISLWVVEASLLIGESNSEGDPIKGRDSTVGCPRERFWT